MRLTVSSKKRFLEDIYTAYHRADHIHPDPLEFLWRFPLVQDREVVGLVASTLAYGRVGQILKSVARVLEGLGESPCQVLQGASREDLRERFCGFRHRFTGSEDLIDLLFAAGKVISLYGSLHECFLHAHSEGESDVSRALELFVRALRVHMLAAENSLLPCPERKSACKRLHLFLRWMVREDAVDPGGWEGISPSKLIVPVDVHMHRVGLALGMTTRRQADLRTALEITGAFRKIAPEDPVRYDFSLTRMGIRNGVDIRAGMHYYGRTGENGRNPKRGVCYG